MLQGSMKSLRKNVNLLTSIRAKSTLTVAEAKNVFKNAQAVCFDVDSTVIEDEGINILADFKGAGPAVTEFTTKAMNGHMPFHEALSTRLNIIRPSMDDLMQCLKKSPPRLSKGVDKLISRLHARGVHVYLVSGGFRQMIAPVAARLGIPSNRVYANNLVFDAEGNYLGFDATEPTSKDMGKHVVVSRLKDVMGYSSVVMIGDGANDLQARPPANIFIGYGGVVQRDFVKSESDWYIMDFEDLLKELD